MHATQQTADSTAGRTSKRWCAKAKMDLYIFCNRHDFCTLAHVAFYAELRRGPVPNMPICTSYCLRVPSLHTAALCYLALTPRTLALHENRSCRVSEGTSTGKHRLESNGMSQIKSNHIESNGVKCSLSAVACCLLLLAVCGCFLFWCLSSFPK